MLTIMPQIETVDQASDAWSALRAVGACRPALVLLDVSLANDEITNLVELIKAEGPQSRCLVLADDVQQQREAQSAGADVALVKGFPAAKLFETIEELLCR
jgi:DNA-binding NarL/FixJ family response regulator